MPAYRILSPGEEAWSAGGIQTPADTSAEALRKLGPYPNGECPWGALTAVPLGAGTKPDRKNDDTRNYDI